MEDAPGRGTSCSLGASVKGVGFTVSHLSLCGHVPPSLISIRFYDGFPFAKVWGFILCVDLTRLRDAQRAGETLFLGGGCFLSQKLGF